MLINSEHQAQRFIPSLDGMRAVAIGLVVFSHYAPVTLAGHNWEPLYIQLGQCGVDLFFVISGFLITFLLCREHRETSRVSLLKFYVRRAFRIFPAFYVFLIVVALVFHLSSKQTWIAGLYLWNYYMPVPPVTVITHLWSLGVEEQFYLVWPVFLKLLRPGRAIALAIGVIVLEPFVRLATYVLCPGLQGSGKIATMFHTRLDTLMFGCLVALLWNSERFKRFADKFVNGFLFTASAGFVLFVSPLLNIYARRLYHAAYFSCEGVALGIILIYLVRNPASLPGRVVNHRALRYVGVVSYSTYLWQQVFLHLPTSWLILKLAAAAGCALASFYLIERPMLRLRARVV